MADRQVKVVLSAQVAEYQKAMLDASRATKQLEAEAKKVADRKKGYEDLAKGAVVVGGAMTALTALVARTGIEYNSLQQKSRAALTTLLGSAVAANEQMDRLDEFARTSPFSKAVFISAQQQMLAFGIEAKKVVPYLDAIQNAVAAAGGSNADIEGIVATMSKIQSSAKLTATDLMEFGNRGVDAAGLIGESMGKTGAQIRSEITAGSLDATEALDALAEGMAKRFEGASAAVKMTFEGATDRVRAAWRDLSADLMKPLVDPNGGGALVDFLNWVADLMRAFQGLPDPIKQVMGLTFALTGLVALLGGSAYLAHTKFVAFKTTIEAAGISMRTLSLVGGGAMLAITALATVVTALSTAQADARQRAQSYADALREGGDAADVMMTRLQEVDRGFMGWQDFGSALDAAEALGLSFETVTGAIIGTDEAVEEVTRTVAAAKDAFNQWTGEGKDAYNAATLLEEAVRRESDALSEGQRMAAQKARAMKSATDATAELEAEAREAASSLDDLKDALSGVGGTAMGMSASIDKAQGSVNKLAEAAKAEGATLDGTNDASIALRDSMRSVEEAHRDAAVAILENGGTLEEARAQWERGRQAIIDARIAMGETPEAAEAMADAILGSSDEVLKRLGEVKQAWDLLPENKTMRVFADTSSARWQIETLLAQAGRPVSLNMQMTPNYQGGVYEQGVQAFASGGFPSGIYRGVRGGIHKFAESEMGVPWETYISGRAADRDRNIGIWQETGRRLGVTAAPAPSLSLDGMSISGQVEIVGDGLGMIINGHIVEAQQAQERADARGYMEAF